MENAKKLAQAKIDELVLVTSSNDVTEEGGQVWAATDDSYVHVLAEPTEIHFSKKENKEQVPYTGYAYGVKFAKTSDEEAETPKYNQLVMAVVQKVGEKETSEVEVRRTRVSSGEKQFKRVPTKALATAVLATS